jgi:hypothetical protein
MEAVMKRSLTLLMAVAILGVTASASATSTKRIPGFHSPTGNIRCLYVPGTRAPSTLLCTIARADYAKTLQGLCMRPNGAGVDWHGFTLGPSRRGMVSCSGGILYNPDTQRPSYVNLAYGRSWRHGAYTCVSRISGVTCRNRTGHGLFISRQSWRAW